MRKRKHNLPKYVTRQINKKSGRPSYRFRKGAFSRQINAAPGSTGFDREYHDCLEEASGKKRKAQAAPGTIAWAVQHYRSTAKYAGLAASTRLSKDRIFDRIADEIGMLEFDRLRTLDVERYMKRQSAFPAAANHTKEALAQVYKMLNRLELTTRNPAALAESYKERRRVTPPLTRDEVSRFRAHWSPETQQRLAFELMLCTGAARIDVVRMSWAGVAGNEITYTARAKTGVQVPAAPIGPNLRACLDHVPTDQATFRQTRNGKPRSEKAFTGWFKKALTDAGIEGKSAHGVRATLSTFAAEAGATSKENQAIMGHKTAAANAGYNDNADRVRLASAAREKLNLDENMSNL